MIMQHVFRKLSLLLLLSFYYGTNVHAKQFPHHRHHHQTTRLHLSHLTYQRVSASVRGAFLAHCVKKEKCCCWRLRLPPYLLQLYVVVIVIHVVVGVQNCAQLKMNYLLEAHKPVKALSVKEAYVRASLDTCMCVCVYVCVCIPDSTSFAVQPRVGSL